MECIRYKEMDTCSLFYSSIPSISTNLLCQALLIVLTSVAIGVVKNIPKIHKYRKIAVR